ncbi:MAG: carboxypeptidase regulatory-like domain-containing protein [Gemmatimonadetes bacterium]|nr:carboxypeptidase regulatory-like domain-containing protein [Gemmatimonadota bacterium]
MSSSAGAPLAGVTLVLTSGEAGAGAASDRDGRFRFDSLVAGRYTLRARQSARAVEW